MYKEDMTMIMDYKRYGNRPRNETKEKCTKFSWKIFYKNMTDNQRRRKSNTDIV